MTSAIDHSEAVHEFLLSPSAYLERPSRIELMETHISWVYLTDRYVYKQKKPVKFEFLDFSTLDRRKHFCEQEVALNQRLSPEVYLGVVPVSVTTGDYQLKRGANVVEWLVKMTKLDERKTLASLIRNEQLTLKQINRLAKRLTDFYTAQAPAMLRSNNFMRSLRQHIFANRNDLLVALPKQEAVIQFVSNAQLRCLALKSDTFVQRVADGRVVDGHGDLRPDHVYYRRGKPAIIDCIEFNEEYRRNDVIDELAFLAMECDRLGNRDVGEMVEAAYLAATSDESEPFLTSFYKCYRACVRAKVAALRATQSIGDVQTDSRHLAEEYLELARGYSTEIAPKVVIMVGGLSGTGKSTLASALRDSLSAELMQTDVIRKELFQPGLPNGKYSPEGRERVYDNMIAQIETSLLHSPTVVLDGTFNSQQTRLLVVEKAKSYGARVLQVECKCPQSIAAERISRRLLEQNDASEATPEILATQELEREQPLCDQPIVNVDTTKELSEQIGLIVEHLSQVFMNS